MRYKGGKVNRFNKSSVKKKYVENSHVSIPIKEEYKKSVLKIEATKKKSVGFSNQNYLYVGHKRFQNI